MLAAFWQRQGLPFEQTRGAFNADPWAVLAGTGRLPFDPASAKAMLGDLAKWTAENLPLVTSVGVDTSVYHHAGATAAQDLAFGMATAVDYLRAMIAAGLTVDAAARQILFRLSVGTHHFLAIAKLRAARKLWSRVIEACGGSPAAGGMRIHARLSERVLTERDPYVNMLRNVVGVFAAAIAGAETITSVPFDSLAGASTDFGRRVARNTLLILQEEAHLDRVVDPAGGSWFFRRDYRSNRPGGVEHFPGDRAVRRHAVRDTTGVVAVQIDAAYAPRAQDIARRKEGITGVSEFPNVREELLVRPWLDAGALLAAAKESLSRSRGRSKPLRKLSSAASMTTSAIDAAAQGASLGKMAAALEFHKSVAKVTPLAIRSFAKPFEDLRNASDEWQERHGRRPQVFLVSLGSAAHYTARAAYAKNFFEAGGFEVIDNDGFTDADAAVQAFAESGAKSAVVCSSDQLYPEVVPQVAPLLKAAGARTVVLAGNPGSNEAAWRASGVDRFIFIKCHVLDTLREMLREEGVLPS